MSRAHSIMRLSESVFNTPQYMLPEHFEKLTSYMIDRNTGKLAWQVDIGAEKERAAKEKAEKDKDKVLALDPVKANSFKRPDFSQYPEETREQARQDYYDFIQYDPKNKLGVLNIEGTTVYRSTPFEAMCGMTSYQRLERTIKAQIAEGAKTILMYVDSGGGEAFGNIETAVNLRNIADASGAKLIAYIDGKSASAAYALSVVAHTVVANPDSEVGSIGVVASLIEDTTKEEGIQTITLFRGDNKVATDDEGRFKEGFIQRVNNTLDRLYGVFTGHVAKYRNMDVKDVVATQASMYTADKALEVGLVDVLMTRADFFGDYLPRQTQRVNSLSFSPFAEITKFKTTCEDVKQMDVKDLDLNQKDNPEVVTLQKSEYEDLMTKVSATDEQIKLAIDAALAEQADTHQQALQALQADIAQKEVDLQALTERAQLAEQSLIDLKHETLMADRREKLEKVLAVDQVEGAMQLAATFSDEQFEAYHATLSSVYQKSKDSLKEKGTKANDEEPTKDYSSILGAAIQKHNQSR